MDKQLPPCGYRLVCVQSELTIGTAKDIRRGQLQLQKFAGSRTKGHKKKATENGEAAGFMVFLSQSSTENLADREESFKIPDFAAASIAVTQPAENLFEQLLQQLKSDSEVHEYLVTFAHDSDRRAMLGAPQESLYAGDRLLQAKSHIPGVTSPYFYVSSGTTAAAMHCEDFYLPSLNINWAGASKLWMIIEPDSFPAFETQMRQHFCRKTCAQFVRHLDCLPSPSLLRSWGVRFNIQEQKAGQLIVLAPYAYHCVINIGPNFAEAINYAPYNWSPHLSYSECLPSCARSQQPIQRSDFMVTEELRSLIIDETSEAPTPPPSKPYKSKKDDLAKTTRQSSRLKGKRGDKKGGTLNEEAEEEEDSDEEGAAENQEDIEDQEAAEGQENAENQEDEEEGEDAENREDAEDAGNVDEEEDVENQEDPDEEEDAENQEDKEEDAENQKNAEDQKIAKDKEITEYQEAVEGREKADEEEDAEDQEIADEEEDTENQKSAEDQESAENKES